MEVRLNWRLQDGVQVYDNGDLELSDWVDMLVQCPVCAMAWRAVSAVGALGADCPFCGYVDPFFEWFIPADADDQRGAGRKRVQ